jgi:predicted transcriptional regulator of viral defense system
MNKLSKPVSQALDQIAAMGGVIRTKHAIDKGIHYRTLTELVRSGKLEVVSRGVYKLSDIDSISNPDLFTVATRIPTGVICLISALSFHNLTTQIPNRVYVAIGRTTETPRLNYPPLSVHRFSGKAFSEGVEIHKIDNVKVSIYSPEKTLADCFKFRNKIGMDVVLEALKFYRSKKNTKMADLYRYARICRVENVMRPYLEALS